MQHLQSHIGLSPSDYYAEDIKWAKFNIDRSRSLCSAREPENRMFPKESEVVHNNVLSATALACDVHCPAEILSLINIEHRVQKY
jgi:hypothetical protein